MLKGRKKEQKHTTRLIRENEFVFEMLWDGEVDEQHNR